MYKSVASDALDMIYLMLTLAVGSSTAIAILPRYSKTLNMLSEIDQEL